MQTSGDHTGVHLEEQVMVIWVLRVQGSATYANVAKVLIGKICPLGSSLFPF